MTELEKKIDTWTTYHAPSPEDVKAHNAIKAAARDFMRSIAANTPGSADQSAALRLVRQAMMTASAAVACAGI